MVAGGFAGAGGTSGWNAVDGTPRKAACSFEPQDIHLRALERCRVIRFKGSEVKRSDLEGHG
jgi:hypothetical protein